MRPKIPPRAALAAAALLLSASAADAQEADNPFPFLNQTPTAPAADADPADALARNLRVLGDDPNNLGALMGAGRAALEVGDPSSSIGFWARADKVSPNNGLVKAGLAAALVQAERPRLAFPLFARATALGVPEADIAADRGLAYDLTGDNRQAQRDYRLAIARHPDPETTRRLALSLAMSGDRADALAALDPLLRKQDMGAWRARAFVLALTGDTAGAIADAHALLPKPQADGISPFLTRLASLNRAQQASAVHFGEMPATGRAATTLTLAANTPSAAGARPGASTASLNRAQAQATASSIPVRTAAAQPARRLPSPGPVSASVDFAGRAPGQTVASAAPPPVRTIPPAIASAAPRSTAPSAVPGFTQSPAPVARSAPPAFAEAAPPAVALAIPPTAARPSPPAVAPPASLGPPRPAPGFGAIARAPATLAPAPSRALPSTPGGASIAPPRAAAPPTRYAANTLGGETLALGDRLPSARTPVPVTRSPRLSTTGDVDDTAPAPASRIASRTPGTDLAAAGRTPTTGRGKAVAASDTDDETPAPKRGQKTTAGAADTKAAAAAKTKAAADAKADRAAKAKALADAKADRDAKAAAKAAPARVWVQVAGGANKHDLGKEWTKLNKQAGALYAGRTPQTVPYRHTNRLMVGPFKSDDEAQEYVNRLAKGGQSGFIVRTGGGEKVEKVPTD